VYAVDDSFFAANRIFEIDTAASNRPSCNGKFTSPTQTAKIAALAASLPDAANADAFDDTDLAALVNADGSVNLDPEGIALASTGGFWIASEGSGTVGDAKRPIKTANLIFKLSASGSLKTSLLCLPMSTPCKQMRFGFEGVAESDGKLVVAFQRAWKPAKPSRALVSMTWQPKPGSSCSTRSTRSVHPTAAG
jgi:hypothetical protein